MITAPIASSLFFASAQNKHTDTAKQLTSIIDKNDATALNSFLQEIDRSDPEIVSFTKLALISDDVSLEAKKALFEGSGIDIHEEIFHGESALTYAERRDDTALLQVLTNKQIPNPATIDCINTTENIENSNLGNELQFGTVAGLIAGATAGSIATFIDKAVVENISGKRTVLESLKDSAQQLSPKQHQNLFSAYRAVAGVCAVTYVAANATETVAGHYKQDSVIPKLIVTTIVNTAASIKRDCILAGLYGKGAVSTLPRASIGLFIIRDGLTMAGAFALPNKLSNHLQDKYNFSAQYAKGIAQIVCPVVMQVGAALFHVAGFDYYNRPNIPLANRWQTIKSTYLPTLAGRSARIFCAYGIGANINAYLREQFSPSSKKL